jgi:HEPN domain-containing protein
MAEVLEKVLKAELIRLGWFLEKTHDLHRLAKQLEMQGSDLNDRVRPLCIGLAQAYFGDRYPGFDLEDPDWPKLKQQLQEITALTTIVKQRVSKTGN